MEVEGEEVSRRYDFRGRKILYVVNVDWFFLSHRLPLALAARAAGAEVAVAAADTGSTAAIAEHGLDFIPLPLSRGGTHPLSELRSVLSLVTIYRRFRPDLVHQVTIKPVIYGSMAARLVAGVAVVNAISGLGYAFSANAGARVLRPLVARLYRVALDHRGSRTIFQNETDLSRFVEHGLIAPARASLIRGSGVDCDEFQPGPPPPDPPIVLLASRLLWDKGVGDFVEAARILRAAGHVARFVLAGAADDENPSAVPARQVEAWVREGVVEWWGNRTDMPEVLRSASMVVLPSRYPEGVPKALIEAAATALPLVATDTPGCRDIVRDGENGYLVPPGDLSALVQAITRLLADPAKRRSLGARGREIVRNDFSLELVVDQTLALYASLLDPAAPPPRSDVSS
jgi:glycosyltransferase involved in cell wall biosynthesis